MQKGKRAKIKPHLNKKGGAGGSHGEGVPLSDVEVRRNPSGDDILIAIRITAARDQLSVQDLRRQTQQHS